MSLCTNFQKCINSRSRITCVVAVVVSDPLTLQTLMVLMNSAGTYSYTQTVRVPTMRARANHGSAQIGMIRGVTIALIP